MPDFIFPFFPDLIRKHIIQSVSKKLLEKLYVKNLGKKHAFEADVLCCHDHRLLLKKLSLQHAEQQVEKVLYANSSTSLFFSIFFVLWKQF